MADPPVVEPIVDDPAVVADLVKDGDPPPVEATWQYADGVPGAGDAPEYFKGDKYATIADQAKGYKELEAKFGAFTGAPEEYEIALSDELKERGVEITNDAPIMEEAIKFAKELNMNNDGFNRMVELYAMTQLAEGDAAELARMEQIKALGDNGQARLDNLNKWGSANLPTELLEGFQEMATSAGAVRALEKLVSMTQSVPIKPGEIIAGPSGVTEEELKAMMWEKDDFGNYKRNTDPEFKARYEKLKNEIWGSGEHNEIVGGR